jgi:hypothetical protein
VFERKKNDLVHPQLSEYENSLVIVRRTGKEGGVGAIEFCIMDECNNLRF